MQKTIKTQLIDIAEAAARPLTRAELAAAYAKITGRKVSQCGNITLGLWVARSSYSDGGYFCRPSKREQRYLAPAGGHSYAVMI